ncbi:MAG: hypothetical protein QW039_00085 [Fervidicoccaceae archaeon]
MEVRQKFRSGSQEVIYESKDIVVMVTPHEDKLSEIILNIIKSRGQVTIKEIHSELKTMASEEKIRKIVNSLRKAKIVNSSKGKYFILSAREEGSQSY